MGRRNALVRWFLKMARKFRVIEERYFLGFTPISQSRFRYIPLWIFDTFILVVKIVNACFMYSVRIVLPPPMKSLNGETILITGAGHGVGRELAIQLAELGATIVCWDSNPYTNNNTVCEIRAKEGECFAFTVDVTVRDDVINTATRLRKQYLDVSMVISNAGSLTVAPICQLKADAVDKMIDVNLLAHFWIVEAFLPGMIERRHGHIVAINSTAGLMPIVDMSAYCAAKYGLKGFMETLTEELRLDTWTQNIYTTSAYLATVSTGLYTLPTHRFTGIYSEITPREAAKLIIEGIRQNEKCICVPVFMKPLIDFNNILPYRIRVILTDFFNFGHRAWFCFC